MDASDYCIEKGKWIVTFSKTSTLLNMMQNVFMMEGKSLYIKFLFYLYPSFSSKASYVRRSVYQSLLYFNCSNYLAGNNSSHNIKTYVQGNISLKRLRWGLVVKHTYKENLRKPVVFLSACVGHSSPSICILTVGNSFKTCIISVNLGKALQPVFLLNRYIPILNRVAKSTEDILRYHQIRFDTLNTLVMYFFVSRKTRSQWSALNIDIYPLPWNATKSKKKIITDKPLYSTVGFQHILHLNENVVLRFCQL